MKHLLSLFLVSIILWWLLSGDPSPLLLGLGVVSAALVVFIAHRMDVIDHEGHPVHLSWRLLCYLPWLVRETVKANIAVARLILHPRMPISPQVMTVIAGQSDDLGRTIYANSITLTPGTVSMSIDGEHILVHAISDAAAADLQSGEMNARVEAMLGERITCS
jgi:multicomponent Na+:H+ antiporter subunit E